MQYSSNKLQKKNSKQIMAVSSSSRYGSGGTYETSSSRQSRFLSSRGEDRVSSSSALTRGEDRYSALTRGEDRYSALTRGEDRYSSSRAEERITSATSNGGVSSIKTSSVSSYSITDGVKATGKPVLRRTCKGVTIERKLMIVEQIYPDHINIYIYIIIHAKYKHSPFRWSHRAARHLFVIKNVCHHKSFN